jgi:transposase
MLDTELYSHLLGISSPWFVSHVDLSVANQRVEVWAEHADGDAFPCPECGTALAIYDHAPERTWRHLDSCQFKTFLKARVPRVNCPDHGVKTVRVSWAEPKSRFTLLFERLAIDVLLACDVLTASRLLCLSWDEANLLKQRAVARGLKRRTSKAAPVIGVDEKAFRRGHRYMTLVTDLETGHVLHVEPERKTESLAAYYAQLTEAERQSIEAVAMDMWPAFVRATREAVPDADRKIVFDRFHVMGKVGEAVDKIRRREHASLLREGDSALSGTKYHWLYARENLPEKHRDSFAVLQTLNLKTARAWAMKEQIRSLWSYQSIGWARKFFARWYFWATHSRLPPMIEAAKTLRRHIEGILNYCRYGITNATSEGVNSKVQKIITQARGFRNESNFRTAILFHCGGLNLYPATH